MITLDQDRFVEVIRKLLAKTYYRYIRMASEKEATLFSVDENRCFFPEKLEPFAFIATIPEWFE